MRCPVKDNSLLPSSWWQSRTENWLQYVYRKRAGSTMLLASQMQPTITADYQVSAVLKMKAASCSKITNQHSVIQPKHVFCINNLLKISDHKMLFCFVDVKVSKMKTVFVFFFAVSNIYHELRPQSSLSQVELLMLKPEITFYAGARPEFFIRWEGRWG